MQVFSCGCGFVRPFLLAAASLSRLHCRPFVEARVERVEIPAVKPVLKSAERFTETLEMDDFPFPQEADRVADVGIFYDTQDVVVCRAGFLLCCNCERTTYHVKQIGQAAFIHAKTEY